MINTINLRWSNIFINLILKIYFLQGLLHNARLCSQYKTLYQQDFALKSIDYDKCVFLGFYWWWFFGGYGCSESKLILPDFTFKYQLYIMSWPVELVISTTTPKNNNQPERLVIGPIRQIITTLHAHEAWSKRSLNYRCSQIQILIQIGYQKTQKLSLPLCLGMFKVHTI